jgi:circadian clock protein KaiB
LINDAAEPLQYRLRLFVAGTTTRSLRAIATLRQICAEYLQGRVDLEVVDIYQQPELAARHQVVAVPLLIRHAPPPLRRIIGDLSQTERVLKGLDLMPLDGGETGSGGDGG